MKWMLEVLPQLSDVITIGIGGALDFVAEAPAVFNAEADNKPARRAPEWMRDRGLEWLYRYFTQPWRKKRIQTATIDFIRAVRHSHLSA